MKSFGIKLLLFSFLLLFSCNLQQKDYLNETPQAKAQRMQWWREAGFGMFIHWGIYAVPAGEWNGQTNHAEWIMKTARIPVQEYEKFALQFNPVKFNADEWVRLAKQAGMKYLVITAKHHDGFCLWNSKVSDYDVIDRTPFKRDILKEVSQACKKYGVRFCVYYSIMDWHHPDAQRLNFPDYESSANPNFKRYVEDYLKPQLKEIIENYGPIGVLWFDGEWIQEWTEEMGKDLYNYVRRLQPDIIVNNRLGGRRGNDANKHPMIGDFGTPEQVILETLLEQPWESCMTMNDHWGYNKHDHNFKSPKTIIHNLIDIAAKNGNYLLNVGPKADGTFPEESVKLLQEIGKWMAVNGEVIYGSRFFKPFREREDLYLMRGKDSTTIYLVATQWPGTVLHSRFVQPVKGSPVYLLGRNQALNWQFDLHNGLIIQIPKELQKRENRPVDYAWVFKVNGHKAPVVAQPIVSIAKEKADEEVFFLDTIKVYLSTPTPGAVIRFTLDGSEPNEQSAKYTKPFVLHQSTILKAKAFKEHYLSSYTRVVPFRKVTRVQRVTFKFPFKEQYSANGELSLFDGQTGGKDYKSGKWLGFEQDDCVVTVDLGKANEIRSVEAGFLHDPKSWIFLPLHMTVELSTDGQHFRKVQQILCPISLKTQGPLRQVFKANFTPQKARFVRVKAKNVEVCPQWHMAHGGKAWIFVDEMIIE